MTTDKADRFNQGKPELSYLLVWPNAINEIAKVCMYGSSKYSKFNYLKGAPISEYIDCALRHLRSYYGEGCDFDGDAATHGWEVRHLAQAAWNIIQALEVSLTRPDLDDRPKVSAKTLLDNAYKTLGKGVVLPPEADAKVSNIETGRTFVEEVTERYKQKKNLRVRDGSYYEKSHRA